MTTTSISDDVRAIEEALAAGPTPGPWVIQRYVGRDAFQIHAWGNESNGWQPKRLPVAWIPNGWYRGDPALHNELEANANLLVACDPARLRRVLDTMKAMGEALRPFVGATLSEQGHVIGLMREDFAKAAAALALYEGTK